MYSAIIRLMFESGMSKICRKVSGPSEGTARTAGNGNPNLEETQMLSPQHESIVLCLHKPLGPEGRLAQRSTTSDLISLLLQPKLSKDVEPEWTQSCSTKSG